LQVVSGFERGSPDWLYLLVTVGDDVEAGSSRLDGGRRRVVQLRADATDPETLADVRRFLRDAMARRIDRISLDGALAQLSAKNAQANFLCAKFIRVNRPIVDGRLRTPLSLPLGVFLSLQSSAIEQVLDILMDILSWEIAEVVSSCLPRGL